MDISGYYVYGFRDTVYDNTYLFCCDIMQDLGLEIFPRIMYGDCCRNVIYGIEIKPGSTINVEQEQKIQYAVTYLKNKYKNTEHLQIGYNVCVCS